MNRRKSLRWLSLLVLSVTRLFSLNPAPPLKQYLHRSYTRQEGTPGLLNVKTLAQTDDGHLWVGAARSPLRFDGVNFLPVTYETGAILESDFRFGRVWFGTSSGISCLRDGKWTTWTSRRGLAEGGVHGITIDERIGLWIMTRDGLVSLPMKQFREIHGAASVLLSNTYGPSDGIRSTDAKSFSPRITQRNRQLYVRTEDGVVAVNSSRAETGMRTGVWTGSGNMFPFRITPRFYQTMYFKIMCVVGAIVGFSILSWFRSWHLRRSFQLVLAERLRLTREIHDTLMQGFFGVVYQLEAASQNFHTSPGLSKQRLDLALTQADRALFEARQMISNLRFRPLEEAPFPDALFNAIETLIEGTAITSNIKIERGSFRLSYKIQVNLYIIVREAVSNAVNHGRPNRISVELRSSANEFVVIVEDDGIGFDLRSAEQMPYHFGLSTIRERAQGIRANITFTTGPGLGTRMQVRSRNPVKPIPCDPFEEADRLLTPPIVRSRLRDEENSTISESFPATSA